MTRPPALPLPKSKHFLFVSPLLFGNYRCAPPSPPLLLPLAMMFSCLCLPLCSSPFHHLIHTTQSEMPLHICGVYQLFTDAFHGTFQRNTTRAGTLRNTPNLSASKAAHKAFLGFHLITRPFHVTGTAIEARQLEAIEMAEFDCLSSECVNAEIYCRNKTSCSLRVVNGCCCN
jgi:hypothetical protein